MTERRKPERWRAVRHFDGRHGSSEQRDADASAHGLRDRQPRDDDVVHRDDEVQIVDGARDERDELATDEHAEQQAESPRRRCRASALR